MMLPGQLDMFSDVRPRRNEGREGRLARDRGMAHAEAKCADAVALAYAALIDLARRKPFIHIDDFLPVLAGLPKKPSPNAMGSIWRKAKIDNVLVESGQFSPCTAHALKRAHNYPIYRSIIFKSNGA